MKTLTTLFLLLCTIALLASDKTPKNSLGLNWGIGHLQRQDFNFTPMIHDAWSPANIAIIYQRSANWEQRANIKFGSYHASISDPFEYYWNTSENVDLSGRHSFTMLDVNYALGKTVYQNDRMKVALGGRSRNRLNTQFYLFGINWLGSFGYYLSFGLDVWTNVQYTIAPKHQLQVEFALPLFSYNARSPYHSQDDWFFENVLSHKVIPTLIEYIKDGQLESWGTSQSVDFDLVYTYALSPRFDLGARYNLSINWNKNPVNYTSIKNIFSLTCNYKF